MAHLQSKTLFFVTSPRSPMKMQPEISLLVSQFNGKPWNPSTQIQFIRALAQDPNFEGTGSPSDMAFSARDRINRGPKAFGFVDISPTVQLTEAGANFIDGELAEEALLRQLLKFQLPSPFHRETSRNVGLFYVKPYLEIFRLIDKLGTVTFDEIMIFGMQLTRYNKFDEIVNKIYKFRAAKNRHNGSYKNFMGEYRDKEIYKIYEEEILSGNTRTRESRDASVQKFIKTKASNMRDYTDACFRYLRATGLVSISQKGRSLSILPEKMEEVHYFLNHIDRRPCFVDDEARYKAYLFDSQLPVLYTDNRDNLEKELAMLTDISVGEIASTSTEDLKKELMKAIQNRKDRIIRDQIQQLKAFKNYTDIINVFTDIKDNNFYDVPLMLEWNTWRAMTMLDGGNIKANLKFDDNGQPMSTASGNIADIVCDYGDFNLSVEVTMSTGQRQYEMEGEPVSRHLAKLKREQGKEAFCFFIAPKINESCIAHFYTLHRTNIAFYGGKSVIIPIELEVFEKMIEQSSNVSYVPDSNQVKQFCEYSMKTANEANDENEWYQSIRNKALNWLTGAFPEDAERLFKVAESK